MNNWHNMRTYQMENPGDKFGFQGVSIAARMTGFYLRNLKLMLDAGVQSEFVPNVIVITHTHLDHFSEIERYLLATENSDSHLTIICPVTSVSALRARIDATYRATKGIPADKPVPYPPHTIIGATIGADSTVIVDIAGKSTDTIGFESTTFRYTNNDRLVAKAAFKTKIKKIRPSRKGVQSSSCIASCETSCTASYEASCETSCTASYEASCETSCATSCDEAEVEHVPVQIVQPESPKHIFDKRLALMGRPYKIEAIRCNHGCIPTTGYGFSECRERIKDEYLVTNETGKRVCKFGREEMAKKKADGTLADLKEVVYTPMFAYICDTDHKVFESDGKNEGYKLEKYPVIMIECTFYAPEDKKKAKKDKHMHWDNLSVYIAAHPEKYFKLIHYSQRYNSHDLDNIQKMISARFPTPHGDTPHVVLCRNDNFVAESKAV
jgi:ribonuclease BN (tRNA processing enzyme)